MEPIDRDSMLSAKAEDGDADLLNSPDSSSALGCIYSAL